MSKYTFFDATQNQKKAKKILPPPTKNKNDKQKQNETNKNWMKIKIQNNVSSQHICQVKKKVKRMS